MLSPSDPTSLSPPETESSGALHRSGPTAESRRLRVAFCLDNTGVGGSELNAVRTAERLDPARFDVMVVCFRDDGPVADRFRRAGVEVVRFRIGRLVSARTTIQMFRFARLLRDRGVQLVHCHDRYSDFFGVLGARLAGVPVIASKRWGQASRRHRLTSRIAFHAADFVLANGESVARSLREEDRVDAARIVLLPNFVDESAFQPLPAAALAALRRQLGLEGTEDRVVGIVASLRPIKEHDTLLRAVAIAARRIPALRLVIVGDGERRRDLERLCDELGIRELVRFAGLLPNSPNVHSLFDVSVLCSESEGSPNALLEAMAAGRPLVGTDVRGIRDVVRHEITGLLVPRGDHAAMAAALVRLLEDQTLAQRLGAHGQAWARREFFADRVIGELEGLYARAVARRRA